MALATNDDADSDANAHFWRRLLHRWLVQYNPLYLLSASLCLAGMILCSRGLAREASLHGELEVAAIAELYAVALIGGAALLTRIGQRRPAVLLALLTAVYQCDLTLHTEACACLGLIGVAAAAVWVLVFVAKLYALAWAVRLKVSISAGAIATLGAAGLAILPHLLQRMDTRGASALVAVWLFALFALGIHGSRSVVSAVELDGWGRTVLRRSLRAVWLLWSLLLVLHVAFWSMNYPVRIAVLVPAALLLGTRWIRREAHVWAVTSGALLLVAAALPEHFSVCALLVAAALGLRTVRLPVVAPPAEAEVTRSPYRAVESDASPLPAVLRASSVAPPTPAARRRLLTGALFASYLAVWTFGWIGGPWPMHLLALDLSVTAVVLISVARTRVRIALAPLAATYAHLAVQARLVSAPASILEWGVASVGLGFALLIASLTASYCLRNVETDG